MMKMKILDCKISDKEKMVWLIAIILTFNYKDFIVHMLDAVYGVGYCGIEPVTHVCIKNVNVLIVWIFIGWFALRVMLSGVGKSGDSG